MYSITYMCVMAKNPLMNPLVETMPIELSSEFGSCSKSTTSSISGFHLRKSTLGKVAFLATIETNKEHVLNLLETQLGALLQRTGKPQHRSKWITHRKTLSHWQCYTPGPSAARRLIAASRGISQVRGSVCYALAETFFVFGMPFSVWQPMTI